MPLRPSWSFVAALGLLLPLVCAAVGCSSRPHNSAAAVGALAPEIEGADLDGVEFKLSDFRGKVVLLEFWGNWFGPCRALYPHTHALLERYAGEPFEVVGVNSDTQLEPLRMVMEKQKVGWRSFSNGPTGPKGPISRAWGVEDWPTIFVLDTKGVIRYRASSIDIPAIEQSIESVLVELQTPVGDAK